MKPYTHTDTHWNEVDKQKDSTINFTIQRTGKPLRQTQQRELTFYNKNIYLKTECLLEWEKDLLIKGLCYSHLMTLDRDSNSVRHDSIVLNIPKRHNTTRTIQINIHLNPHTWLHIAIVWPNTRRHLNGEEL